MESKAGRMGRRRGFSDQWGESEISERRDLSETSLARMTCHLEAKQVTESAEGRSWSRSWVMVWRVSEGDGGGGSVAERIFRRGLLGLL